MVRLSDALRIFCCGIITKEQIIEHFFDAPRIRYSSYEYKRDSNDDLYITVSKDAKPEMYHPMQEAGQLAIGAVNVGLAAMHRAPEEELKEAVPGLTLPHQKQHLHSPAKYYMIMKRTGVH